MAFDEGKMSPSVDVIKPFLLGSTLAASEANLSVRHCQVFQPNLTLITLLPAYLKGPPPYCVCGWVPTLPPNIKTSL